MGETARSSFLRGLEAEGGDDGEQQQEAARGEGDGPAQKQKDLPLRLPVRIPQAKPRNRKRKQSSGGRVNLVDPSLDSNLFRNSFKLNMWRRQGNSCLVIVLIWKIY